MSLAFSPCPPLLLVLSAQRPRQALSGLHLPPTQVPGIWHAPRRALGDIVLVHLKGLPERLPGASLLRMMVTPRTLAEAQSLISALLADPAVLQSTKEALMEELMNETIPSTDVEHKTLLAQIREGHREGLREGHREGLREGLLRIARHRLDEAAVTELETTSDLATLEARLLELLDAD
ncbi:MAG: hypothetical protein ABI333_13405 [bacterium]